MKSLKVMSIIGLVFASLTLLCSILYANPVEYMSAVSWGIILSLWTIAMGIVGIVQASK